MDGKAPNTTHKARGIRRGGRLAASSALAVAGLTLTASAAFGGFDKLAQTVRDNVYCKVVRDCVYEHPPKTRIVKGPKGVTDDATPSFRFASNERGVSYRCRVDDDAFDECDNPHTTARLEQGKHELEVYAVDRDGVRDKSPAQRPFAVDTREPDCSVARGPHRTSDRSPSFWLRTNEKGSKLEFRLDRKGRFHRTDRKVTLRKLRTGQHVLEVRATDRAGNRDRSPDKHRFKVMRKRHRHH
jgi:hypothetical protein